MVDKTTATFIFIGILFSTVLFSVKHYSFTWTTLAHASDTAIPIGCSDK